MARGLLQIVGERVRRIRKARNLTQEELGEKAGFHFSYIGRLERGQQNLSLLNLEKIADALETSVLELFSDPKQIKLLKTKEEDITAILELLKDQSPGDIKRARNTLRGMFGEIE